MIKVEGNTQVKVIMKEFCVFVILVSVSGAKCSLLWYLCTALPRERARERENTLS